MKAVTPITAAFLAMTLMLAGVVAGQDRTSSNVVAVPEPDEAYETDAVASQSCCDMSDYCADSCCGLSNCGYCPTWTFSMGALIMDRASPEDAVLVTEGADPASNVILRAGDLDFDWRGGFELGMIRHNVRCSCWDLEARYFRIDGWRAAFGTVLSPNGAYQQYVTPIGNDEVPVQVSAIYQSHLDGFELNLRRPIACSWFTALCGFRFVELDERGLTVDYNMGPGLNFATHQVDAINDMYGFQVGADACLWNGCRLIVDAKIRAGMYGNECGNNVWIFHEVGPSYGSRATDSQTAFLGELGFTGTVRLVDGLALRAGYQLMWLAGVALAPDQIAVSDPANGLATVDTDGSALYHGFVISLEYAR
jgi:hypothetical protein